MRIINTLDQLSEVIAIYCNGPRTDDAKAVPMKRFSKLNGEERATLSEYSALYTEQFLFDLNVPGMIEALLGLVESDGSLPTFTTIGGKAYSATKNTKNRKKSDSRIGPVTKEGTYSNLMVRMLWILNLNDPGIIDWDGFIQSWQHRLLAALIARDIVLSNGGKLPYFPAILGMPPQFRDATDKGKARTDRDDDFCDPTQFSFDLLQTVQTDLHGEPLETSDLDKVRTDCIALRKKVLGNLSNRLKGSDVNKTGDKMTSDQLTELIDRCGGEESVMDFVARIYENQRSQSGKLDRQWTLLFSPSIVGTGLILAGNRESVLESYLAENVTRRDDETVEDYSERRIEARRAFLSDEIRIDRETVETFLKEFVQTTSDNGTFSNNFKELFDKIRTDKKSAAAKKLHFEPLSVPSMSAFVQLVKNHLEGSTGNVWTSYRNIGSSEKPEYSPEYRCFGGVDIGYTSKGKKSDE